METPTSVEVKEFETIVDGVFHDLNFIERDPKDALKGRTVVRRVLVRKIPFTKVDELGKSWGKFKAEVCLYLDLQTQEVDKLDDESFKKALKEGRRLNFTSLKEWFELQVQTLEGLGQGDKFKEVLGAAMEKVKNLMP